MSNVQSDNCTQYIFWTNLFLVWRDIKLIFLNSIAATQEWNTHGTLPSICFILKEAINWMESKKARKKN